MSDFRSKVEEIVATFTDFKACEITCDTRYLRGGVYNCQSCATDRILALIAADRAGLEARIKAKDKVLKIARAQIARTLPCPNKVWNSDGEVILTEIDKALEVGK